ncbi:MAG: LysM peptidoglycan-binding domain-containing protein [Verrucomicrobiales bacterium]|nr:LysM peptidoglycan-binding domain-containing protein [Verrucomicrobiales bacterium]
MNFSISTLRILLPAALALSVVSCGKNKVADNNPYQDNPYYGPQSSTYGTGTTAAANNTGGGYTDYTGAAPANNGGASYPTYSDNSYTPPAPASNPAPAYTDTYASNSYGSGGGAGATHTVVQGDTLFSLSRRYGTSVAAIQSANGLSSDLIRTGQTLQIPRG